MKSSVRSSVSDEKREDEIEASSPSKKIKFEVGDASTSQDSQTSNAPADDSGFVTQPPLANHNHVGDASTSQDSQTSNAPADDSGFVTQPPLANHNHVGDASTSQDSQTSNAPADDSGFVTQPPLVNHNHELPREPQPPTVPTQDMPSQPQEVSFSETEKKALRDALKVVLENKENFNLTEDYHTFWLAMYKPPYCVGGNIKLLDSKKFSDEELLEIAKVLRRGWEDERYLPEMLAQPFLEACLFNRGKRELVTTAQPDVLLNFVDPSDRLVLETGLKEGVITREIKKTLCGYYHYLCRNDGVQSFFTEIVLRIMYDNEKRVIKLWTAELVGIMELDEFRFAMSKKPTIDISEEFDYLDKEVPDKVVTPPHRLWKNYFYGWDEQKIKFYINLVKYDRFKIVVAKCLDCGESNCIAKHIVSNCPEGLPLMKKERHDCVMNIFVRELKHALEKKKGLFAKGSEWDQLIVMYGNKLYKWPTVLDNEQLLDRYPHIVVYSTTPEKKVLIIELSVAAEYRMNWERENMEKHYAEVTPTLEANGFKVIFELVIMGCRGVVDKCVYQVLKHHFGMTHSEVSKTMEEISKKIVTVPYNMVKEQLLP